MGRDKALRERGRASRHAIVGAAMSLFGQRGYRGTTVAAVAEKVGLTETAVLYHYRTKDDLLVAVLAHADRLYQAQMDDMTALRGVHALEQVARWGVGMAAEPDLIALHVKLSAEHLTDTSATHRFFTRRYETLLEWVSARFQEAVADGDLDPGLDPEQESRAMLAQVDGLRLQLFYLPDAPLAADVERYVAATLDRLAVPGGTRRARPG